MQYPLTDLQVFRTQKEAELGCIIAVTPRWQGYIPPSSVSGVTLQPPLNAPAGVISAIVVDGAADSAVKTGGTVSNKRKVSGPIVNAAVEELAALDATVVDILCGDCSRIATCYCTHAKCEDTKNMCPTHLAIHTENKTTKGHVVIEGAAASTMTTPAMCAEHPKQELMGCCRNCNNAPVCALCLFGAHNAHKVCLADLM